MNAWRTRSLQITPRDLEILARVSATRACDSAAVADLFPTARALQQRLWRLARECFLKVHHVGNQRAYSLGRRGAWILGLAEKEVRVSRSAAMQCLVCARVRRALRAEGYLPNGQDQIGRTVVLWAWRAEQRIAAVVCDPGASPRAMHRLVQRLRPLVNPFGPLVDELMIFGPPQALRRTTRLPVASLGRVTIRPFPLTSANSGRQEDH